jgi:hypothetical protein
MLDNLGDPFAEPGAYIDQAIRAALVFDRVMQ